MLSEVPPEHLAAAARPVLEKIRHDAQEMPHWLCSILLWLADNLLDARKTSRQLAQEAVFEDDEVARVFCDLLEVTPQEYVTEHRLEIAAKVLVKVQVKAGGFCRALGFATPSAFSRLFRTYYLKRPQDFHRSAQEHPERAARQPPIRDRDLRAFLLGVLPPRKAKVIREHLGLTLQELGEKSPPRPSLGFGRSFPFIDPNG